MSWRQKLRPASFRGVGFHVSEADDSGGRRLAEHEYPLRDTPFAEDMGRKARTTRIEAFLVGPEYMAARDRLIGVVEKAGPGVLIHPWLGSRTVHVREYAMRHSSDEGGMCRISITFAESGDSLHPAKSTDTRARVHAQAKAVRTALTAAFPRRFSVRGLPSFVSGSALIFLAGAAGAVRGVMETVAGIADFRSLAMAHVAGLLADGVTLLAIPTTLGNRVAAMVAEISGLAGIPGSELDGFRLLIQDHGSASGSAASQARRELLAIRPERWTPPPPRTTTTRIREANNREALIQLVEVSCLVEASRAMVSQDFTSAQEANAIGGEVLERLDGIMESPRLDDTLFASLSDLRAAVAQDVTLRAADLPRITTRTLPVTLPALVTAYRLLGDPSREQEIVSRNRVRHPGFVPGGQPLEILSHAA